MAKQLIILDSNIFSELLKPAPDAQVIENYSANLTHIGLATTVWHELNYGVSIMPLGKRRMLIENFLVNQVAQLPTYAYDKSSALLHAKIRAKAKKKGKMLSFADSQIAAITMANQAILATRNVKDFADIEGLEVINWFSQ